MEKRKARKWSRSELIVAISLYCQIPFGKMDSKNQYVAAIATRLNRSPSSIALKLVNFASLDPYHEARGVSGMRNVSKLDREVWDEYYGSWDQLGVAIDISSLESATSTVTGAPLDGNGGLYVTEVIRTEAKRRGQGFFRNAVLAAHDQKCCVTGIACRSLLRASHIIPWATSEIERLNPENGLCLNSLHDAAFDRGLITLTDDLEIVLSKKLSAKMPNEIFSAYFEKYENRSICLPHRFIPGKSFIKYHRENIFQIN